MVVLWGIHVKVQTYCSDRTSVKTTYITVFNIPKKHGRRLVCAGSVNSRMHINKLWVSGARLNQLLSITINDSIIAKQHTHTHKHTMMLYIHVLVFLNEKARHVQCDLVWPYLSSIKCSVDLNLFVPMDRHDSVQSLPQILRFCTNKYMHIALRSFC